MAKKKTLDEVLEAFNDSDVREESDNIVSALDCAETCEKLADLKTNLLEAKKAAGTLIAHIDGLVDLIDE